MEPIGIVFMLGVLAAALWGLQVAGMIIFGDRGATLWLRGLLVLTIGSVLVWLLDSRSLGEMMRRSLKLLDAGLIIAIGDGITRITRWIDEHTGHPPPKRSVEH
jgi:hypothetical protein